MAVLLASVAAVSIASIAWGKSAFSIDWDDIPATSQAIIIV